MKILAIGDVVGQRSIDYLASHLRPIQSSLGVDLTVANGENASEIHGLSKRDAEAILDCGVDLITLGNHAFGLSVLYDYLDNSPHIIRPANYPPEAPGNGYTVYTAEGWRILCINVCGRVFMDPLASPFDTVDRILEREEGNYDFALMDIHAEATSEKMAIARYFDGRVAVMFGTHTHVPTADLQILPGGSGYVTDLGMCGPTDGILGTKREAVIHRFRTQMPTRFEVAEGKIAAQGVIFDLDCTQKRVTDVKRIEF